MCTCLPEWIHTLSGQNLSKHMRCAGCGELITDKKMGAQTFHFACGWRVVGTHFVSVYFHIETSCLDRFHTTHDHSGFYTILPFSVDRLCDKFTKEQQQELSNAVLIQFHVTGHKCAACNRLEREPKHFKWCGACKVVKYCSTACQANDWKKHKLVCEQPPCGCIRKDALALTYQQRQNTDNCCNPTCNKKVPNQIKPIMACFECATKQTDMHMFWPKFCSDECIKKATGS